MITRCRRSVLLAALCMVGIAGCPASDDIGTTLPVSGKVTIDGKPLESGTVVYHPDEQKGNKTKALPTGMIKNGEYTLSSASVTTTKQGAPPGWYKVTIDPAAGMMGAAPPAPPKAKVDTNAANSGLATSKGGVPLAKVYSDAKNTPLVVEVKSGNNAAYNLDAKSK